MSAHHAQAVRMSEIGHRRSADPVLDHCAFDILSTRTRTGKAWACTPRSTAPATDAPRHLRTHARVTVHEIADTWAPYLDGE